MDEKPDTAPPTSVDSTEPGVSGELRLLRRSRSDRVIAGVLGGLGLRLGVDPVLLRVATAVLALFGGVGILLYAIAWLLVPAEDDEVSVLEQAVGRREVRDAAAVPLTLALGALVVLSSAVVLGSSGAARILLIVAAIGLFLLFRRRVEGARSGSEEETWGAGAGPYDDLQVAGTGPIDDAGVGGWPATTGDPAAAWASWRTPSAQQAQTEQAAQPAQEGQTVQREQAGSPAVAGARQDVDDGGGRTSEDDRVAGAGTTDESTADGRAVADERTAPGERTSGDESAVTDERTADGDAAAGATAADERTATTADPAARWSSAGEPSGTASGWPEGPDWNAPQTGGSGYGGYYIPRQSEPEPECPPERKRPRSHLGVLTVCLALVAVGVLATVDASWASVPAPLYVAVPLAVVALGLLVGTWFGRSRGLIALGVVLALALIPASFSSFWDSSAGRVVLTAPAAVADLPDEPVEHGMGELIYDLSTLQLADGDEVTVTMRLGLGQLTVTVPEEADVVVSTTVGVGGQNVFDESTDGIGQERRFTDNGPDGPGGGQIELDIEVGMGQIDVERASGADVEVGS